MFIVDAHLDLAYNALNNSRRLHLRLDELRASESPDSHYGRATVTIPELKRGDVALVFATLFVHPASSPLVSAQDRIIYKNAEEAHKRAMEQLDYYHRLADEDEGIVLVGDLSALDALLASHEPESEALLGILPLMEGADPIRHPEELELWFERGLRLIGPAWDDTRYSAGAWREGETGLTRAGFRLLELMEEFSMILDLTHMSEQATYQALDTYQGPVAATHSNARTLVPGQRQLSDAQIRRIGEREGVIGIALYNAFLRPNYRRSGPREQVTLSHVVAHIDHICQVLGNSTQVGIGSDFDGGFGAEDIPAEMDSIADLKLLADKLAQSGYEAVDIANILGGNWIRLIRLALP